MPPRRNLVVVKLPAPGVLVNAAGQHFLDGWQAGQAIDVPKVIRVLLSAEALHMTSSPVFVDGGQLIETHRRFVVPLLANAQGYAGTILSDAELFIAWRLNGGLVQLRANASTSRALWVTLVISFMRVARTEGEMSSQRGLPSSSYGIWGVSLTKPDHEACSLDRIMKMVTWEFKARPMLVSAR